MKLWITRALLIGMLIATAISVACDSIGGFLPPDDSFASDSRPLDINIETRKILANSPIRPFRAKEAIPARVIDVINGDTIEVELITGNGTPGERFIVGYTGVEAPRYEHRVRGTEPMGKAAVARNRQLVEGREVLLETGVTKEDLNGRALRYVYVDDLMINSILVYEGLAKVKFYAPGAGLMHAPILYKLQNKAIANRSGGWQRDWNSLIPHR